MPLSCSIVMEKKARQYILDNITNAIYNNVCGAKVDLIARLGKSKIKVSDLLELKIGDVITKIDNLELTKMCDLRCYIYTKKPTDEVTLTILRNNKEQQIKVTLGKK